MKPLHASHCQHFIVRGPLPVPAPFAPVKPFPFIVHFVAPFEGRYKRKGPQWHQLPRDALPRFCQTPQRPPRAKCVAPRMQRERILHAMRGKGGRGVKGILWESAGLLLMASSAPSARGVGCGSLAAVGRLQRPWDESARFRSGPISAAGARHPKPSSWPRGGTWSMSSRTSTARHAITRSTTATENRARARPVVSFPHEHLHPPAESC